MALMEDVDTIATGYSVVFVVTQLWVQVILLGIAIAVTIHLAKIKTFSAID